MITRQYKIVMSVPLGIFCTLIRNIPFKAVGTVAENKISLNVQGQRSHFRINGTEV